MMVLENAAEILRIDFRSEFHFGINDLNIQDDGTFYVIT